MSTTPFPIDPYLSAIAIAYRNRRMIADDVLPRVAVGKSEFKYMEYDMAEGFTVPDTKVGRKSAPNEVEFTAEEKPGMTEDHGLDDVIPVHDIENAPENYDPVSRAVEQLTNVVELGRETRVAGTVFNAANYAASQTQTLSGAAQWSDAASDPLRLIMESLDTVIMRPNIGVMGRAVATKLTMHPKVVKAYNGTSGDEGVVPLSFLANLLELEAIYVGEAFINTAKKGQAPAMARAWGKHAAFLYRDMMADTRTGTTWGLTAQFGDRVAGRMEEPKTGLRGSIRVRSGESVQELVTAKDLGYFIQNAVA